MEARGLWQGPGGCGPSHGAGHNHHPLATYEPHRQFLRKDVAPPTRRMPNISKHNSLVYTLQSIAVDIKLLNAHNVRRV